MATSGTYALTVTAGTMIDDILTEIGVLGRNQTAKSYDSAKVMQRLNYWLLQQNSGSNALRVGNMMWTRESATLTLTITDASYDLKPSGGDLDIQIPVELISVVYRDSSGYDTPLEAMTLRDYAEVVDKDGSGNPQRYYYERRIDTGKLYLDYVPSTADSLIIYYKQPLEIITARTEEFDIDPVWHMATLKNVAGLCCPMYGIGVDNPRYIAIMNDAAGAMKLVNDAFPNRIEIQAHP